MSEEKELVKLAKAVLGADDGSEGILKTFTNAAKKYSERKVTVKAFKKSVKVSVDLPLSGYTELVFVLDMRRDEVKLKSTHRKLNGKTYGAYPSSRMMGRLVKGIMEDFEKLNVEEEENAGGEDVVAEILWGGLDKQLSRKGWKMDGSATRGYERKTFRKDYDFGVEGASGEMYATVGTLDGKISLTVSFTIYGLSYLWFRLGVEKAPVTQYGRLTGEEKELVKVVKKTGDAVIELYERFISEKGPWVIEKADEKNKGKRKEEEAKRQRMEEIQKERERREHEEAKQRKREEAERKKRENAERKRLEKERKELEKRKKQGLSLQDILDSMQGWAAGQFRDKDEPFINGNWVDYLVRTEYYDDDEYAEQAAQNWLDKKLRYEGWTEGKEVETSVDAEEKGWVTVSVSPKRK
jgi:hypothetical protein